MDANNAKHTANQASPRGNAPIRAHFGGRGGTESPRKKPPLPWGEGAGG